MIERIEKLWGEWKDTAVGKAAQDFFWSVLYSSVAAGLSAALPVVAGGQTDLKIVWGVFYAGVSVSFLKALSLFIDKYRNPQVPNTPQG